MWLGAARSATHDKAGGRLLTPLPGPPPPDQRGPCWLDRVAPWMASRHSRAGSVKRERRIDSTIVQDLRTSLICMRALQQSDALIGGLPTHSGDRRTAHDELGAGLARRPARRLPTPPPAPSPSSAVGDRASGRPRQTCHPPPRAAYVFPSATSRSVPRPPPAPRCHTGG